MCFSFGVDLTPSVRVERTYPLCSRSDHSHIVEVTHTLGTRFHKNFNYQREPPSVQITQIRVQKSQELQQSLCRNPHARKATKHIILPCATEINCLRLYSHIELTSCARMHHYLGFGPLPHQHTIAHDGPRISSRSKYYKSPPLSSELVDPNNLEKPAYRAVLFN